MRNIHIVGADFILGNQNGLLMEEGAQILSDLIDGIAGSIDEGDDQRQLFRIPAVLMEVPALREVEGKRNMIAFTDIFQDADVLRRHVLLLQGL